MTPSETSPVAALKLYALPWHMVQAWSDLRASYRALMAGAPSESRLLFLAMLSGLIWFLGQTIIRAGSPPDPTMTADQRSAEVAAHFVAALFFRTLMLYGVAALAQLAMRKAGGTGGWVESRGATFWAALVAAPALALVEVLAWLVGLPLLSDIGPVIFAITLAFCLAEAHGVDNGWKVFGGIVAVSLAVFAFGFGIGALFGIGG